MPIIITRGNNVFGRYQYPEKLISKFILQLLNNKKCTIHGEGKSIRNFVYIDDVVSAFETILIKGQIGSIYNIGTENEYSVIEVTKKLIELIKNNKNYDNYIEYVKDRIWNDSRYAITNHKLKELGWKEKYTFKEGLKLTIDWYKNNMNYWD